MGSPLKRFGLGVLLACAASTVLVGQRGAPIPTKKALKPAKPWADEKTIEKQQQDAEKRKLFATTAPVTITITGNFKAVQNDRNPDSTKTFPATLEYVNDDGTPGTAEVRIRTRGHMRRMFQTCDFAPLRVEFPKAQVKKSVFDAQSALKLGTHCRDGVKEFEQYVLREYAAYRIHNLLTPRSFRARLAKVTYVDVTSKKRYPPRYGMFIEDDDDVAKRLGGRATEDPKALAGLNRDDFTQMAIFEYMIGNLDVSIIAQHNVRLIELPSGTVYAVPYDFDYSGLVDTVYAVPPPSVKVGSVRERVFRGPCRTAPELDTFFANFRQIRPQLEPLYDSLTDMDARAKKRALEFLDQFYKTLDRQGLVKAAFMDNCYKRGMM
jgi:hypothetical protein